MKLYFLFRRLVSKLKGNNIVNFDNIEQNTIKLNLGCGNMYLNGWINIDISKDVKSDLCIPFTEINIHFEENTIDEILMLHSISYLNLWEARLFFKEIFSLLKKNGKYVLEFPDIAKCSKYLIENKNYNLNKYLEAVRGIYAFDLDQIRNQEKYTPYSFGWSSEHLIIELKKIGFSKIIIENPKSHGELLWRDTRVVAIK